MDDRDLNYEKYFSEGVQNQSLPEDYNSHNTQRLDVEQVKSVLLSLDEVRQQLGYESA